MAFNIADSHQGRGSARSCSSTWPRRRASAGSPRFVADVLPQNRKMLGVFTEAGYEVSHRYEDGVIALSLRHLARPSTPTRCASRASTGRVAQHAGGCCTPRSVAVVGASRGAGLDRPPAAARTSLAGRFTGALHVVNPEADRGARACRATPRVDRCARPGRPGGRRGPGRGRRATSSGDCAAAGVRGLVVVSSGFAETGADGAVAAARPRPRWRAPTACGSSGPNSFGMVNTDEDVRLNASLAPQLPPPGRLGLFSQSGALGIAVLASAARRGLGISTFVSAGNRADVSGNDLHAVLDRRPGAPTPSGSTWRASATRASSPGSPGGSPGSSR